jgi:hypothetical protein
MLSHIFAGKPGLSAKWRVPLRAVVPLMGGTVKCQPVYTSAASGRERPLRPHAVVQHPARNEDAVLVATSLNHSSGIHRTWPRFPGWPLYLAYACHSLTNYGSIFNFLVGNHCRRTP